MSDSEAELLMHDVETVDNFEEKELACKQVNHECENCYYYCHCKNVNDEFHCMFECDSICCPLI